MIIIINVLYFTEYGVTMIENKDGYKNIHTKPYTKEEQNIKYICFYIKWYKIFYETVFDI